MTAAFERAVTGHLLQDIKMASWQQFLFFFSANDLINLVVCRQLGCGM